MTDAIGKNTPSAEKLRGYVDRVEAIEQSIKDLREDKKRVMAEAKSNGFSSRGMRHIFAARKLKPHDRQEQEAERDIYMHAMGMATEPPLFRQLGVMAADSLTKDKLIETMKMFVPPSGEIILKIGGKPMRLWRDKNDQPQAEEFDPLKVAESTSKAPSRPAPKDVPVCSGEEAEAMGEAAAKANVAVIDNPFPFGHENRPRWDEGWRRGAGNNGMGG